MKLMWVLNITAKHQIVLFMQNIYISDIIHGKLDQECKRVEVDVALGRDARLEDAASIADVLADWCNACEAVLSSVDRHIQRANHNKQRAIRHQQGIEQEVKSMYINPLTSMGCYKSLEK
jgi:COP9 signalosome complex subunit 7